MHTQDIAKASQTVLELKKDKIVDKNVQLKRLLTKEETKRMRHAGHIVALVHQKMKEVIEPGISTLELDSIAMKVIKDNKAIPTFKGYCGFPASICAEAGRAGFSALAMSSGFT